MTGFIVDPSGNNLVDSFGNYIVSPTPMVAFVGSALSHGGSVTGGSPDVLTNGIDTARLGDPAACAIHGAVVISTASNSVFANGKGVARAGDSCSCGAILTTGSTNTFAGN